MPTFYIAGYMLWPPPWNTDSLLGKLLAALWLIPLLPIMVTTMLVMIPYSIASGLFGWGARATLTKTEVAEILEDAARGENISRFNQFAWTRIETRPRHNGLGCHKVMRGY